MLINFSAFRRNEKVNIPWNFTWPTVIKLEKYLFFILIAQAYGLVSNDDAVVSNSTVTLFPTVAFIQDVVL